MRLTASRFLPFLGLLLCATIAQAQVSIIPQPQHVSVGQGVFKLHQGERIDAPADARAHWIAEFLRDKIQTQTGLSLLVTKAPENAQIVLRVDPSIHGQDAYHLDVKPDHVMISAADNEGLFWGVRAPLLPGQLHQKADCVDVVLQIQRVSLAPYRRPGLAYRDQTLPQVDQRRRLAHRRGWQTRWRVLHPGPGS